LNYASALCANQKSTVKNHQLTTIALVSANIYRTPYPVYPLGVSYLASYLNHRLPDCRIEIFDFNLNSFEEYASFLSSQNFDVVGISLRNIDDTNIFAQNDFILHYQKVMTVTRENSKATVIIGGSGFSVFPEQVFAALQPDYAVHGEGEESFRKFVVALKSGNGEFGQIDGLVYRDAAGNIQINRRREYISSPTLHIDDRLAEFYWERSGMLNIQTKRGCPYRCIYCSYPIVDGSRVRTLDADMVVRNIEELYHRKGIGYLFFTDSVFNICNEYNRLLARKLIESNMKIKWGAYFSPGDLTREDLELYRRSGLTHIEFGSDSFSDTLLEKYGKNFRFGDILEQSNACSQLGIFYAHFLILGGYGETETTLNETIENTGKLIPNSTVIFPYVGMRIYPRTKLCEIALDEGVIRDSNELINPTYYVSKDIDVNALEERTARTNQKWIFPGDEMSPLIERFRAKKRRGPLWEYLRFSMP
jgi:radical SAM superfamily enzyme YgiQ (UPF0313 family)